jgi:hypothetical protein
MKKHNKPRLQLSSQTIRQLDIKDLTPDRLQLVVGGEPKSHEPGTACSTRPG